MISVFTWDSDAFIFSKTKRRPGEKKARFLNSETGTNAE